MNKEANKDAMGLDKILDKRSRMFLYISLQTDNNVLCKTRINELNYVIDKIRKKIERLQIKIDEKCKKLEHMDIDVNKLC